MNKSEFEDILNSNREEDTQVYLKEHPDILQNTFSMGRRKFYPIPKFKLGNEHVTDFLLIEYATSSIEVILIELEPPTCTPFNKNHTFSTRLNTAIGQVTDWVVWIYENADYFERCLDKRCFKKSRFNALGRLKTKIIIGRRSMLTEQDNKRREALYGMTSGQIEILHYDRLLESFD